MKKARHIWLIMTAAIALFILAGCMGSVERVSSISLKDHDPNSVIEMTAGDFDYTPYILVVTYNTGRTEELPLTEELINGADLFKFHQVGEHEIAITYQRQSYMFKVSVQRSTLGHLAFPENNVFTYDGKAHTVEVVGDMPANAVVTYLGGNSFVNAGTYDVTAIVSCEGYGTVQLSTTVKIKRATYDMSGVTFAGKEVVYDGNAHSVEISGTLPRGVAQPTYIINEKATSSVTEVGEYTVIARFANNDPNYESIPDMTTTITIKRASYDVSGLDLVFKNQEGVVFSDRQKVYDGDSVSVDLNDAAKLPKKASVSYLVLDAAGNVISTSNQLTNIVGAGTYTVRAEFTLADSKNYNPLEPIERTFTVTKMDYPPVSGIYFDAASFVYSGDARSLKIEGKLPADVTVSYEYYLNGTLVVDGEGKPVQSVTDAGRYTVKAVFTHGDANRKDIEPLTAVLQIARAELDLSELTFAVSGTSTYDGTAKELVLQDTLPEGITLSYEYYKDGQLLLGEDNATPAKTVTNAGEYMARILSESTNPNYAVSGLLEYSFSISRAEIPLAGITIEGESSYVYDGTAKRPVIKGVPEGASLTVVETLYSKDMYGSRTEMQTPAVDCGSYVIQYEIRHQEDQNYVIVGEPVHEKSFTIIQKVIDVSGVMLKGESSISYDGKDHTPILEGLPEHVTATMTVTRDEQSVSESVNAGVYRCEVTLKPETANYKLSSTATLSLNYEINKIYYDVGELGFDETEFDYNAGHQAPALTGAVIPTLGVDMTVTLYKRNGEELDEVTETIVPGQYHIVVKLTAQNSNYVLNGNKDFVCDYEIQVVVINVDNLEFDSLEFTYDGGSHQPTLLVPEHVKTSISIYIAEPHSYIYGEYTEGSYVGNAIDAGKYICSVSLYAENEYYTLSGQVSYKSVFTISTMKVTDLGELYKSDNKLSYPDSGFTDATLDEAIAQAIFGDMRGCVDACAVSAIKIAETGESISAESIESGVRYKITLHVKMMPNYSFNIGERVGILETDVTDIYFVFE